MSIKETLERFDEKFVQITYPFLGGMRLFWNTTPDEKRIDEMQKINDIKQFITEEIKLAVEETIREVLELVRDLDIFGYPAITKEEYKEMLNDILNKLKKYETIRNI